jgi:hypothetical protein
VFAITLSGLWLAFRRVETPVGGFSRFSRPRVR